MQMLGTIKENGFAEMPICKDGTFGSGSIDHNRIAISD